MSQVEFDEDTATKIEALYRIGDAVRRRRIVREALGAARGERILDVGCGPGFYAELAEEVGPSGSVVGVDSSPAMLELAARRCAGHLGVALRSADAVSLPVDDVSFDAALCVQVLEYVPDPTVALAEMHRALRPGGRVVVWDVDWATVSLHALDSALTERVLRLGRAPHPPLPAHTRAPAARGGFRGGSHAGTSVLHLRARPRHLRRGPWSRWWRAPWSDTTGSPTAGPGMGLRAAAARRARRVLPPAPSSASRPRSRACDEGVRGAYPMNCASAAATGAGASIWRRWVAPGMSASTQCANHSCKSRRLSTKRVRWPCRGWRAPGR